MARVQSGGAVSVEGLAELRKALGDIGGKPLQKNFRKRMVKVGDDVLVPAVQAKMPVKTGRARRTVKAGASGNTAYVQEGSPSVPYPKWLDFGGVLKPTGGRRNTISRPNVNGGRYLHPTVREKRGAIANAAGDAFEDTARELGLK
jgi:hypothetical protein